MRYVIVIFALVMGSVTASNAQDEAPLRLSVPPEMIDTGFMKHLLPRFRFRTQIGIDPVAEDATAEMAFVAGIGQGKRIFSDETGADIHLVLKSSDAAIVEKHGRFLKWLKSAPGVAAIEGFPAGGPPAYTTGGVVEVVEAEEVIEGDVAGGSRLALQHCGRCHVVDERNRMGGIGSTPSFAALRARTNWSDLFRVFWAENPHPSFTQVTDVTEPFPAERPAHIAPVEITLDEIDAILAFVATLDPKNLGQPVQSN